MENKDLYLDILSERENKKKFIEDHINEYQIITLKANIPGSNKQLPISYLLLNYFDNLIINKFLCTKQYFDTIDGPYIIYLISYDYICLKDDMVYLEEHHPLGRFMDIDVYYHNPISMSRGTMRKCYLCDNQAFICGRNKSHTILELIDFIQNNTFDYINNMIKEITYNSMISELDLHPKFGLITPYTNGSHQDMNYQMMKDCIDVIKEDMPLYFMEGFSNHDYKSLLDNLRELGKNTEKKMLKVSNGINTYKGFIFCGGIMTACVGLKVSSFNPDSIFDICKKLCKNITEELKNVNDTYGGLVYQKYLITGARGEAEKGYPIIQYLLDNYNPDYSNKIDILINIISLCEDTILLKRCNDFNKYLDIKEKFNKYLLNKNNHDFDKNNYIESLNEYCLINNLSFGGSADLFILYELVSIYKQIFNI